MLKNGGKTELIPHENKYFVQSLALLYSASYNRKNTIRIKLSHELKRKKEKKNDINIFLSMAQIKYIIIHKANP